MFLPTVCTAFYIVGIQEILDSLKIFFRKNNFESNVKDVEETREERTREIR